MSSSGTGREFDTQKWLEQWIRQRELYRFGVSPRIIVEIAEGTDAAGKVKIEDLRERALVADADYVAHEVLSGAVLSGDALQKMMPSVVNVLRAAAACRDCSVKGESTENTAGQDNASPLEVLENEFGTLMAQLSPVTVQSLRDTQWAGAGAPGLGFLGYIWAALKRAFSFSSRHAASLQGGVASMGGEAEGKFGSPADRFSDKLLYGTLFVLALVIANSILGLQPVANTSASKQPATQNQHARPPAVKPHASTPPNTTPHR